MSSTHLHAQEFVSGLLMDRTHTTKGAEFFSKFSLAWQEIPQSDRVNVTVKESYHPRRGNLISILVEEKIVFNVPLTPRKPVEQNKIDAAKNAVSRAAKLPVSHVIF